MGRPSKMTRGKIETITERLGQGVSIRDIAREIGVDEKTVRNWVQKLAGKAERAERRAGRTRAAAGDVEAAKGILSTPLPSPGDPEALESARARAALIRGLLERLAPEVEDEKYPATSYVTLAKYSDELDRLIAQLTPPAPKNPDEDPDVLEAEKVLIARIERLIVEAEARRAS